MTVEQLITELQKYDPSLTVYRKNEGAFTYAAAPIRHLDVMKGCEAAEEARTMSREDIDKDEEVLLIT